LNLLAGLRENRAATDPAHEESGLRGRTYAIPFEAVWQASLGLVGGRLPRWSHVRSDDVTGTILADVAPAFLRPAADVLIKVTLDENAQTRVDMSISSRTEHWDLGASYRRVARFYKALDQGLDVRDGQILDPLALPGFRPLGT